MRLLRKILPYPFTLPDRTELELFFESAVEDFVVVPPDVGKLGVYEIRFRNGYVLELSPEELDKLQVES